MEHALCASISAVKEKMPTEGVAMLFPRWIQYFVPLGVFTLMRVLLLGASGLLGHNVLRTLLSEGHEVVALVRRADSLRLPDKGYHTVIGSLLDDCVLESAAEGCEAIINCAGTTDMSLLRMEDYLPVNYHLCQRLVRIIKSHGISRLVHVSTVNTMGYGEVGRPAKEDEPMRPPFKGSNYADSKKLGEEVVLQAAAQMPDRHIVVINPGYMLGPYDVKPSSGALLRAAYKKRLMVAPRGGKSFVHVGDVAQAVAQALERGCSGQRYIVTNSHGSHTIKELYEMQARAMGYRQRVIVMPDGLLLAVAKVGDCLRGLGVRTALSTRNVRQLLVREYYDNSHAIKDIGLIDTPVDKAIIEFHNWKNTNKI